MFNLQRIADFISYRRRKAGLTQQQVADRLGVSYQAVSKWETGVACPNVELLPDLAALLGVTTDELLAGHEKMEEGLSYRKAGVDISYTDAMKEGMKAALSTDNPRVMGGVGPFASLYDIHFPEMAHPVLVLKAEEPGSKQKLATAYGMTGSICRDMVNHLVNDIAVMGARPLAVLDTIVCGSAEKDTINSLVRGVAEACRENGCCLVGGETSVQPGVVEKGTYILTSSVAGIVERDAIIDGSKIRPGHRVLALSSNGLHTNGYSLVRLLLERYPSLQEELMEDGETFLNQLMRPHTPYYPALKGVLDKGLISGMAHITGGGIRGNLSRVIPDGLSAVIDLEKLRPQPLFRRIREMGAVEDGEMLSTFNCGVGLTLVAPPEACGTLKAHFEQFFPCYEIGVIREGEPKVAFTGNVQW